MGTDMDAESREICKEEEDQRAGVQNDAAMGNGDTDAHKKETCRFLCSHGADEALQLYYCGSEICSPGHFFGPAVRTHYLIHFILDGKGIYLRNGERHALRTGDAFLILPEETTKYIADETEPWTYTWIAFDGKEAEILLEYCGLSGGNVVYHSQDALQMKRLFERVKEFQESFHDWDRNVLEITGKFYLIFSCMYAGQDGTKYLAGTQTMAGQAIRGARLRTDGMPEEGTDIYMPDGLERYYWQAAEYLQNNFSYPVKVDQLARQIGVSRTYLYKAFIRCSKKSVQHYLRDLRLEEACRLLRTTGRSITDIAYSCGFKDSPSFCKQFRNANGCSPLQFRKREESRSERY